ncbi:MAG: hypothetical protein IJ087_01585 [Eggerthellaceae bacterium]|nr:hypothetical protein [Eggerthellaceae bacterium]
MDWKKNPANWEKLAKVVKGEAGWKCEECGMQCRRPGEPFDTHKRTLIVAHLNHRPWDCRRENLKALCFGCYLRYDAEHHAMTRKVNKMKRNSETFKQHELERDQVDASDLIRDSAENLEAFIALRCEPGREKSLALTKLEECVMWANKSIALHGVWTDFEGC